MIKRSSCILFLALFFLNGCTKGDLPPTNSSASKQPEKVVLTAYASEGGWIGSPGTLLTRRDFFWLVRSPGTEITITAEPADGNYFDKWSNGWTANPLTFKLNVDMEITAEFKPFSD